ncbi:MAG: ubiquinol-cytochrome C chaperone family protein [Sphingomicrobium sp.]
MLGFLFPRLTPAEPRGRALFEAAVQKARAPFWYADLNVPDTLDGRFSVLATVTALITLRLEHGGDRLRSASVALTERFVEAMDAEHRQIGLGDPTLGKVVRKLVGSLGRRVDLWRPVLAGEGSWESAAAGSVAGDHDSDNDAARVGALRDLWSTLENTSNEDLLQGRLG